MANVNFDDLEYTREAIIKQAINIEDHGVDGSAVDAGCSCIESKHLYNWETKSEEGTVIATDQEEKEFYLQLSSFARLVRKKIEAGDFNMHGIMSEIMKGYKVPGNPRTRAYLPHNLTEREKASASIRKKLSACIKETEVKCCGENTTNYEGCTCNPVAVCRAAVT